MIDTAGHIVTNEHVIQGASSVTVTFDDQSTYKATIVGSDESTDLAVLKVNAPASVLHPLSFGDSSTVAVGDGVVAVGDPYQLDDTVTSGIVSAVGREITSPNNMPIENAIQTDAAINHGNSGGPLLNLDAKVIGITAQIQSQGGGNEGIGFAIPSSTVQSVTSQLIQTGKVEHALLGINGRHDPGEPRRHDRRRLGCGRDAGRVRLRRRQGEPEGFDRDRSRSRVSTIRPAAT